ncbi:unnamed protein product, partial [Meganyctiphanes norvegica]
MDSMSLSNESLTDMAPGKPVFLDDYYSEEMYNMNYQNFTSEDYFYPHILFIDDPNDLWYPWKSNSQFYPSLMTYLVTLLFGAIGNITVIILMAGERKTLTTTNMFLVSLSVADLLMLLLCVPLEIITFFVVLWDQSAVCKM